MKKIVRIFGIPMDLGQQRRGVDMGPSAIRYAGLQRQLTQLGFDVYDCGNITAPQAEQVETPATTEGNILYLQPVAAVCAQIYAEVGACLAADEYGIFLGGDHSMSIGTVAAVRQQADSAVLWIDAHADMNTPQTSPSGNIHGMPLAALLGRGPDALTRLGAHYPVLQPAQVAMVGVRDVDNSERAFVRASGAAVYTMREVDELGIGRVAARILEAFAPYPYIHVSLDLDACDPTIAPGVGTPVMGGLSYREAHLLMEILADSGKVRTVDVVEINPILDERNKTAQMAVELIGSLFGRRIL